MMDVLLSHAEYESAQKHRREELSRLLAEASELSAAGSAEADNVSGHVATGGDRNEFMDIFWAIHKVREMLPTGGA